MVFVLSLSHSYKNMTIPFKQNFPQENPDLHIKRLEAVINFASFSPDPSTQLAAMIWDTYTNTFVMDCNDFVYCKEIDLHDKNLKSKYVEHAERRVIYQAAAHGFKTYNTIMYCSWIACLPCARAIIAAKIKEVYTLPENSAYVNSKTWAIEAAEGRLMLEDAGIKVNYIDTVKKQPVRIGGIEVYV